MKILGTLLLLAGLFLTLFSSHKTVDPERLNSDHFIQRNQSVQWIPAMSSVMVVVGIVIVVVERRKGHVHHGRGH